MEERRWSRWTHCKKWIPQPLCSNPNQHFQRQEILTLTLTLKPNLNTSTAHKSSEDQPKYPHSQGQIECLFWSLCSQLAHMQSSDSLGFVHLTCMQIPVAETCIWTNAPTITNDYYVACRDSGNISLVLSNPSPAVAPKDNSSHTHESDMTVPSIPWWKATIYCFFVFWHWNVCCGLSSFFSVKFRMLNAMSCSA